MIEPTITDTISNNIKSELYDIIHKNDVDALKSFIKRGNSVDYCEGSSTYTTEDELAINQALLFNAYLLIPDLIANASDIVKLNSEAKVPFIISAIEKGNINAVRLLLKTNIDPAKDVYEFDGTGPLHALSRVKDEDVARKLYYDLTYKGVGIESKDKLGRTPLHTAVQHSNPVLISLLIFEGAYINAKDKYEQTPLHYAAAYVKDTDILDYLISNGAALEEKDNHGYTPLMLAVKYLNFAAVSKLVASGASVKTKDNAGNTVLHMLSYSADNINEYFIRAAEHVLKILMDNGASWALRVCNKKGETPLETARSNNAIKLAAELIKEGAQFIPD